MKKIFSVFLCLITVLSAVQLTAFAGEAKTSLNAENYIITNPYENVDWDTVSTYKAQFHCHTNASDGFLTIKEAVSRYYDLDYDIVAITDHGTNNLGWNKVPENIPLMRAIKKERSGGAYNPIIPLSEEEYTSYLNGTAVPSDGIVRTNDDGLVDVALGNELNMATPFADCHLTHYWCDYGQGLAGVYGDYETPSKESSKQGGVVMLAHVGEYVYTNKDTTSRYHVGQPVEEYYANKFARIFLDNAVGKQAGSVCGMGINSSEDEHTRCDRILYDEILAKTIPNGVVPWGFTFSDSHNIASMNNAYCMMLIPDWHELDNAQRNEKLRSCMENGEFFAVSHYSNGVELDGEREFTGIEPDTSWDPELLATMNDTPIVRRISVDEKEDTITVETENADRIVWVSDGNVIKREVSEMDKENKCVFTLSLHGDDLKEGLNYYVRFYITGPQGICYSQPMVIKAADANGNPVEYAPVDVPKTRDLPAFLRAFVTVLDWLIFKWNPVIWAFKYFALGYNPIERLINELTFWK